MDDHDDERPEPRGPVVTEDLVKSVKGVTGCDDATAARLLRAAHGDADAAAAMFFDDMNDGDDAFDDDYDDEARGDGDSVYERRAAAGMDGARDAAAEGGAADDEEASAIDSILGLARKAGPADGDRRADRKPAGGADPWAGLSGYKLGGGDDDDGAKAGAKGAKDDGGGAADGDGGAPAAGGAGGARARGEKVKEVRVWFFADGFTVDDTPEPAPEAAPAPAPAPRRTGVATLSSFGGGGGGGARGGRHPLERMPRLPPLRPYDTDASERFLAELRRGLVPSELIERDAAAGERPAPVTIMVSDHRPDP